LSRYPAPLRLRVMGRRVSVSRLFSPSNQQLPHIDSHNTLGSGVQRPFLLTELETYSLSQNLMSSSMSVLCAAAVRVTAGLGTKTLAFLLASGRWIVSQSKTFISDSHVRLPALKRWHLWTGILGGLSLLFSVLAFWTSLDSSRYARWTAHKYFALLCMDDVGFVLSEIFIFFFLSPCLLHGFG